MVCTDNSYFFSIEKVLMNKKFVSLIGVIILMVFMTACAKKDSDSKTSSTSSTLFVTVGNKGTIFSSTDTNTWTSRTSGTSEHFRRVFYKEKPPLKPTPSSHVSNSHLILHESDILQVTPTNSSQSQRTSTKLPLNSS